MIIEIIKNKTNEIIIAKDRNIHDQIMIIDPDDRIISLIDKRIIYKDDTVIIIIVKKIPIIKKPIKDIKEKIIIEEIIKIKTKDIITLNQIKKDINKYFL